MFEPIEFPTERLRLRRWKTADREPFAAMNADPEVMKFFAGVGARESSNRSIDVWQSEIEHRGWSNWAVEHVESGTFMGFVGLSVPRRALPFAPCVETGWRLAKAFWGRGFATEAPTFGLPCPTAIFTLGLLLFSVKPVARWVFIDPLLWAAVGSLAAFQPGVIEDLGLLAAGIVTIAVMVFSPAAADPLLNADARGDTTRDG
jgi:Acetyltransferase (GNAT) domain/Family of unknown function (DUF6064)